MNKEQQDRLNKIKSITKEHGGKCISDEYVNAHSKMNFVCKEGHEFKMMPTHIMQKCWCRKCYDNSRKLTIKNINEQYAVLNIKCISTEYIGNKAELDWECLICHYIFRQSKNGMDKDFTRCRNCKNIEALQKACAAAELRGGVCLASAYTDSRDKMECRCSNGHTFYIRYANLVSIGQWCPHCSANNHISEEICRVYFESLFGLLFPKIRPEWLRTPKGDKLELDGYCEELCLAFEHNGSYHYEEVSAWRHDLNDLECRDKLKLETCKLNDIKLIVIPVLFHKTPFSKLKEFIFSKCKELGISIPFKDAKIDLSKCYDNQQFDLYKSIAAEKGGRCVSEDYFGAANQKLIWECVLGHQWEQFPYVIKKGHWCPVCAGQMWSPNILPMELCK